MNGTEPDVKEKTITFDYTFVRDDKIKPGTIFFIVSDLPENLERFINEDNEYYSKFKIDMPTGPSYLQVAHLFIRKYGWIVLAQLKDARIKARSIRNPLRRKILSTDIEIIMVNIKKGD